MLPLNKEFINMNEYSNLGHNIDESRGENVSINVICNKLKEIENGSSNEVKSFIHKIKNLKVKSNLDKSCCFTDEFNEIICSWNSSSPKIGRVNVSMLEEFISDLRVNNEFIKAYVFKDENKIKLWIVVKDSVSDKADEIYSDFLNTYNDDEYSIMIYDNEVLEYVEKQVKFITNNYEVVSKDECSSS
jgi:hypothetical protein